MDTPATSPPGSELPAVAPAAASSNAVAIDLLHALRRQTPDANLFFSPSSIATALTLVAEGARSHTRAEMSRILHLDPSLPADAPLTNLHAAYAAIARRFSFAGAPPDPATRTLMAWLQSQIVNLDRCIDAAKSAREYLVAHDLQAKADKISTDLSTLAAGSNPCTLQFGAGVWVAHDCPIQPAFARTIQHHYPDAFGTLDFRTSGEAARRYINTWIESHTAGQIRDMLGAIHPDARIVIATAIYFLGFWAQPFDPADTRTDPFTLADGRRVPVAMLSQHNRADVPFAAFAPNGNHLDLPVYASPHSPFAPANDSAGFQVAALPYKGDALSMILIVPNAPDGLPAVESLLTPVALATWIRALRPRTVHIALPKFKLEAELELSGVLAAMGMPSAFTRASEDHSADFTGICADPAEINRLFISEVLHEARIEVTEKGTEAAAATVVAMRGTGPPGPAPIIPTLRADRPFLYLIRDDASGLILFLGRMTRPPA